MKPPEVRILAGRWKGRRLEAGASARPTSSKARQAIFSILAGRIGGARVLDLYAGSGAVGLEAVSRGALSAVLVEVDAVALRRSVERIGAGPGETRIVEASVGPAVRALVRAGERFDLVFADPPYASADAVGELVEAAALLRDGGVLVLQQDGGAPAPGLAGLELLDRREYGRNVFCFYGMR
ncbi:MAG TPA: RsmD family RNA methyltransferase [Thermoanaerobaculia bacterium]|nr:RsmD family RNA methyltransferase [Thermoanaerobaculia bacterium]